MSLAELMVAMGIMALLTGLAVLPLRAKSPLAKANPDAVATVLSSELRSARLRAMSKSMPVGVIIPSQNGSRGHSQSIYVLEGYLPGASPRNPILPPEPPPKMVRVLDFSKEYPGVYIYAGGWDVDSAALTEPTLTPAIGDSLGTSLENWTKPTNKDYQLVFMPDGRVISNDLPHFDGNFHLVVAANLSYTTTGPPPGTPSMTTSPAYFKLTGVHQPITLSISLQGGVASTKALLASTGVVDCQAGAPSIPAAGAPLLSLVVNSPPQVADVTIMPPPNPDPDLSGGFDAVVRPDGFLTLVIRIVDPQGDQVSCQWNDEEVGGARTGSFTIPPGKQSIEYDAVQGCWIASAIWQPPVDARSGDRFRLTATVSDPLGASYTLDGDAAIKVETRNAGRFFFSDQGYVCSLNGDGSGIRRLARGTDPEVSPDGSMVAFLQGTDVAVMQSDGSQVKVVATGELGSPTWSPDGLYLAFDQGGTEVKFVRLHDKKVSTVALPGSRPRWSSRDVLVYQQPGTTVTQLTTAPIVAGNLFLSTPVPPTPTMITLPAPHDASNVQNAAWSSDGGYLTFQTSAGILSCDAAGTTVVERYTPPPGSTAQRSWMMVGEPATKMVFVESSSGNGKLKMCNVNLSDANPAGATVVLRTGQLDGSCSWVP
ncbi:MAG: PD40 domain-containing protein [Candidatus Eremiobacteraeota bacterium]|nr:PD40 domain-containing protein [Candidatus Eremiobacteraeota bacterium]MCW5866730.1 PD40 domain-containing protein [Candidatus Eremiobacteraeota bacterium]